MKIEEKIEEMLDKILDEKYEKGNNLYEGFFGTFKETFGMFKETMRVSKQILLLQKDIKNKNTNDLIESGLKIINDSKLDIDYKEKYKEGFFTGVWNELQKQFQNKSGQEIKEISKIDKKYLKYFS